MKKQFNQSIINWIILLFFISFFSICSTLSAKAQNVVYSTESTIDTSGNYVLNTVLIDKDVVYKAVSTTVKEGVKAKKTCHVDINYNESLVAYDKETKIYTVEYKGKVILRTTTVAAVRTQLIASYYKEITGKDFHEN